jgi:hypothetical protein
MSNVVPKSQRDIARCAADGQLYDVEFSGKDMVRVYTVYRRKHHDRIEQVRYRISANFAGRQNPTAPPG